MNITLGGQTVPGLRCIVASNPSPMTAEGTNTYVLGQDELTIIDPGPNDPRHLAALLDAINGRRVAHLVVTHSHLDHSGLCSALSHACNAPVVAFGDALAGRSAIMHQLAQAGLTGGGEGVDTLFRPDLVVTDNDQIDTDLGPLRVIHTPGHMGNHICLSLNGIVFSGDHVMDWSTSLVSPPDGDLTDYMRSLTRLQEEGASLLLPGHGRPVTDPTARIATLIAHRQMRETQILAALTTGPSVIADLTARVYAEIAPELHPAAARNVFAHLIDLTSRNLVSAEPHLQPDARFALT